MNRNQRRRASKSRIELTRLSVKSRAAFAAATMVPLTVFFNAPAHAEPDCRPLVLGVGGSGQQQVGYQAPSVMKGMLEAERAQGNNTEWVDYPSGMWPTSGAYTMDESVRIGDDMVAARIAQYRNDCPGGHVKLMGHSEGALVAGDSQHLADETVLYADPRRKGGLLDLVPGIVPGMSSDGPRELGPNTTSVCHGNDLICDASTDPLQLVQALVGYGFQQRHGYAPGEEGDRSGDVFIPTAPPIVELPQNLGIPVFDLPTMPLPKWEPGPLVQFVPPPDLTQYTPRTVGSFLPPVVANALPAEVSGWVPPPLPFELPRLP